MKLAATQALYAYWSSQCRGRCAPDRHDLNPMEMRGLLPNVFMLEVDVRTGAFPIRISGTRLDALFGRDLKGVSLADLCAGEDYGTLRAILDGVLDDARPAVAGLMGAPEGYAPTIFELLVLPLRHHGRTHSRLLCGLFPTQTARWFGLREIEGLSLSSWRFIDRGVKVAPERTSAGGLRREHLVIYQGGRATDEPSTPAVQSRVKAGVPRSRDMHFSTRGS